MDYLSNKGSAQAATEAFNKVANEAISSGKLTTVEIAELNALMNKTQVSVDAMGLLGDNGIGGTVGGYAGKSYSGTRNPDVDFTNKKGNSTLEIHFKNHAVDFGYITETEYLNGARGFMEKPPTSTTQSFITKEGTYFRYDTSTNEFGIINKYGGVSTYYKPPTGIGYWLEQINKYY
jgi:hypothetical protein